MPNKTKAKFADFVFTPLDAKIPPPEDYRTLFFDLKPLIDAVAK